MSNHSTILPQTLGDTEECLRLLEQGIESQMSTTTHWTLAGEKVSKHDLLTRVRLYKKAFALVRDAEKAFHEATKGRDLLAPELSEFLADMLATLVSQFGRKSTKLEDFGFRPRKDARSLTAEQTAEKVVKARRTRQGQTSSETPKSSGPGVAA
jgi:hypothetical protein